MTHKQACATAFRNVLIAHNNDYLGVIPTHVAKEHTNYRLVVDDAAYRRLRVKAGLPEYETN